MGIAQACKHLPEAVFQCCPSLEVKAWGVAAATFSAPGPVPQGMQPLPF